MEAKDPHPQDILCPLCKCRKKAILLSVVSCIPNLSEVYDSSQTSCGGIFPFLVKSML